MKERSAMAKHKTGTRKEWLAARLELLGAEKELTRLSDDLTRRRQELPWVRIDKEYRFATDEGSASLRDLFRGRSQLLIYATSMPCRAARQTNVQCRVRGSLSGCTMKEIATKSVNEATVDRTIGCDIERGSGLDTLVYSDSP
jgi:predicted dithiol-disulfide oxidoreductase (DUF899 family)